MTTADKEPTDKSPGWWNDPRLTIGLTDFAEVAGDKADKIRAEYTAQFDHDPETPKPSFKTSAKVMGLLILRAVGTLILLLIVLSVTITARLVTWIATEMTDHDPSRKANRTNRR
jgi:hypothetical protein